LRAHSEDKEAVAAVKSRIDMVAVPADTESTAHRARVGGEGAR